MQRTLLIPVKASSTDYTVEVTIPDAVATVTQGEPTYKATGATPIVIPLPGVELPVLTKATRVLSKVADWRTALGGSITDVNYLGEPAIKYEVKRTDPLAASGRRAETWGLGGQTVAEKWIKTRIAIPTDWTDEPNPLITVVLMQFHDDWDGHTEFHSPFDLSISGKTWVVNVRSGTTAEKEKSYVLAPVVKGKFVELLIHLKFNRDGVANGIQQIWMDGKLMLDKTDPMGYVFSGRNLPYGKQGLYAWAFNDDTQMKYAVASKYTAYFGARSEWDNVSVKPV